MIVSAEQLSDASALGADICIVGAGAAGITLACELDGSDLKVLLLEAGGFAADLAASHEMYRGSTDGTHPNPSEYRRTGLGGTTQIWGGRCVPFDAIDFERRDYVPNSGWPIRYEEMAAHYPKALEYCEAGANDFTVAGSLPQGIPTIPGLDTSERRLLDGIERYSLPTNFGRSHRARLERSTNVNVLLNARCVRVRKRAGEERVESVEIVDRAGARRQITATRFVLATGGIEAARLLLASEPEGAGLGNGHDLVGRYYTCHFENVCAKLVTNGAPAAFAFEKTLDGIYARRKLQFPDSVQREHRLLNSAFRLHFPEYSDAAHRSSVLSAIYLAKSFLIAEYQQILQHGAEPAVTSPRLEHLRNVLLGLPQIVAFGFTWLFRIVLAQRKLPYTLIANADGSYPIEFNSEQIPLASNRITLTNETDKDGLRRVGVHWQLSEDDIAAGQRAFLQLRDAVDATPQCRMLFDETQLRARMSLSVPVGGHHIGTTRMGATAREGVVDQNCAVFGLPNLHIASASVFPTSSHANPTLSIVAMAVRLAAHLKTP